MEREREREAYKAEREEGERDVVVERERDGRSHEYILFATRNEYSLGCSLTTNALGEINVP
jgi:hypothetical protein